jgi:hypothetical protein
MSKSAVVLSCGLIASNAGSPASALAQSADLVAVQSVIESAYVTGVFITRDSNSVRRGFHPRFILSVLQSDTVLVVPLDAWLARLRLDGRRTTDQVQHTIDHISITANTAHVTMRLSINGRHVYTDYMGLYRFPEGWRIVNKIFQDHD